MTLEELQQKLKENKIHESAYSLDDGIGPNKMVLYRNYHRWEIFYISERGERSITTTFYNEAEACDFFWSKFENYHVGIRPYPTDPFTKKS
jgi:hypothetical protein